MKINVMCSTMVRPMAATPSGSIWLSNLDLMYPIEYHTHFAYFYRSTGAANFFDAAALKAALSRALVEFYPIAGRLKRSENDRIEINCNGEGVLFVEAECDGEMDDLGDHFTPRPELRLTPTVDYSQGISTIPLSMMQVTRFKCGGVCLGISNHHQALDGLSGLHFINTWSDIARGLGVTAPPFLDRTILSARNPPQPQFSHIEYQPLPTTMKTPQLHDSKVSDETTYSIFKLTSDQVRALKAKCIQDDDGGNRVYSRYKVVTGHVWRCVCMARWQLPEDQETKLHIATDGRSRLLPPLPQHYCGNAVFMVTPVASCGELRSNPVSFAVRKVHETLTRVVDDEYLRSALDYLEWQADVSTIRRGAHTFRCPNLGIISWISLPFYEADFGWGKPTYVGPGAPSSEGKCHLLETPAKNDGLLVAIALPKEQMQLFEKFLYEI